MRTTKLDVVKLTLSVIVVTSMNTISHKLFSRYSAKDK